MKVLCVLYDDPIDGYPKTYARADLPRLDHYPNGQSLPSPQSIDFAPGELLGCVCVERRVCARAIGAALAAVSCHRGPW